jgi:hypothetical protein
VGPLNPEGTRIGSVVPAAGGQQAVKEREAKAIADVNAEWDREGSGPTFNATVPSSIGGLTAK